MMIKAIMQVTSNTTSTRETDYDMYGSSGKKQLQSNTKYHCKQIDRFVWKYWRVEKLAERLLAGFQLLK